MALSRKLRIAVEGCVKGHGALDPIYSSIEKACEVKGWDGVDLVIIGGDFQAVRNQEDLSVTAMPAKYRQMGDYHKYYDGTKRAPYLTIFIGGNHEASNHLFELYYGGWVAPNIYYLGAANVLRFGPLKIAGISGIWKGSDYRKPHFERLPYSEGTMRSIYHTRELDVRKLLSYRSQVDIGVSHDWPQGIEWLGDHKSLFRAKPYLEEDARSGRLNSVAARDVLDWLRPLHWFSAHHHYKFTAVKKFTRDNHGSNQNSEAISAWNKFHANTQLDEISEAESHLQATRQRQEQAGRTGQRVVPNYTLEEIFKPVEADGINRKLVKNPTESQNRVPNPQLDGTEFTLPQKRQHGSNHVQSSQQTAVNADNMASIADSQCDGAVSSLLRIVDPAAIDIDMSDDDLQDEVDKKHAIYSAHSSGHTPSKANDVSQTTTISPTVAPPTHNDTSSKNESHVSTEMREKLAAISNTFSETTNSQAPSKLPHPDTIYNPETKFLALSKCEAGKDFLQLMQIEPTNKGIDSFEPLKLQYDPEWLAILRVFAPELVLSGSSSDRGPQHKGDKFYQDCITKEGEWIKENIVEKGLLDVPENFEMTTQGRSGNDVTDLPREVTNPQTTQFCKLIGIENQFDISEEERDQRMAAGAPQEGRYHHNKTNRGRGSRGNYGGGRSRGGRGGRHRW